MPTIVGYHDITKGPDHWPVMQSPAVAEAMDHDGVVPETLVILVEA